MRRGTHIKSGSIGIIHLFYLPLCSLCSLRSLWLNHSDATGNNITTAILVRMHKLSQKPGFLISGDMASATGEIAPQAANI